MTQLDCLDLTFLTANQCEQTIENKFAQTLPKGPEILLEKEI